jgi:glycosidase
VANPRVREEIERIMGFWLELGVSGFRVDAVPFLLDPSGVMPGKGSLPDPMEFLRSLRAFLGRRSGEAILLGEANLPHEAQVDYFGGESGDALTMQFDFVVMANLYLSLARGDAGPLTAALADRPPINIASQWANFVRNHDELTLDKLSDAEREEVFTAFAPEESMRVYGRGIVRRLPPMLGGDPRRIRMVYSLLFAMPGTPVLFYGEELGMGENLAIEGRKSVRTPMQWTDGPNGGFSNARPARLAAPVTEGGYSPEHVNASAQRHDADSLLRFIRTLIERVRTSPEMGWGALTILEHNDPAVLAHAVASGEGRMVAVHNLSAEPTSVHLLLDELEEGDRLIDLLRDGAAVQPDARGRVELALDGYGYRWLRVLGADNKRLS